MNIRIVLVEPSHPGNIGATARAMKTMDLQELHLVNPQRFPDPQADWRAAGALDIVTSAVVHDNLESAIGDCEFVAGTSVRDRHIPWTVLDAEEFSQQIVTASNNDQTAAVLFGRENNGLTNEELSMCNVHVRIPSSSDYGSLNVAMAVQVVTYELFKARGLDQIKTAWDRPRANHAQVSAMYHHLDNVLDKIGFFEPGAPRTAELRLRRLFGRIELDETEVQILRGILTHIEHKLENVDRTQ